MVRGLYLAAVYNNLPWLVLHWWTLIRRGEGGGADWTVQLKCRAKPKGSICSLYKWAYTAFWLCRADSLSSELWLTGKCAVQLTVHPNTRNRWQWHRQHWFCHENAMDTSTQYLHLTFQHSKTATILQQKTKKFRQTIQYLEKTIKSKKKMADCYHKILEWQCWIQINGTLIYLWYESFMLFNFSWPVLLYFHNTFFYSHQAAHGST